MTPAHASAPRAGDASVRCTQARPAASASVRRERAGRGSRADDAREEAVHLRPTLRRAVWLLACVIAIATSLLVPPVDVPREIGWWLASAAHLVMFGGLALVLLALFPAHGAQRRLGAYALAFAGTVVVGIATEIAQLPGPRDADPWDVARDAAGALMALAARAQVVRRQHRAR
jgi:hypothetical protein